MQAFSSLLRFYSRQRRWFPITDQLPSSCSDRHVCVSHVGTTVLYPIYFLLKNTHSELIKLGGARKTMGIG